MSQEYNIETVKNIEIKYKVYARTNNKKQVERFFSTCFEEPSDKDEFIKQGNGDEFVHVGYYQVYDDNMCHNYKVIGHELLECTDEDKELELKERENNTLKTETFEEKINRLEQELANTQDLLIMISNNGLEV